MNQTSLLPYRRSFVAIAICSLVLFCTHSPATLAAEKAAPAAAKTQEAGRIVIVRSANLGGTVVGVSIDGKDVTKLHYNGRYDAPISAGPHTLTSVPVPDSEHAGVSELKVTVEPGKTYKFTAKRSDVRIVLK